MAFPVHPARRDGLRLDASAGARRSRVAGPHASGDVVGQSQRLSVRARAHEWAGPARQAVREGTWASGLDDKGRPIRVQSPTEEGVVIFPHAVGGTNWMSPSFSPRTGLFYIPSLMDSYATFPRRAVEFV